MTLTVERLRELLDYDATAGTFRWRKARGPRHAGRIAGTVHPDGSTYLCIDGAFHSARRLAIVYVEGAFPDKVMMAKGRDATDTRYASLVPATNSQRAASEKKKSTNTSGYRGVSYHHGAREYRAYIMRDRKQKHLGTFSDPAEAGKAYDRAARELFGEFAYQNFPELLRPPDLKMHL